MKFILHSTDHANARLNFLVSRSGTLWLAYQTKTPDRQSWADVITARRVPVNFTDAQGLVIRLPWVLATEAWTGVRDNSFYLCVVWQKDYYVARLAATRTDTSAWLTASGKPDGTPLNEVSDKYRVRVQAKPPLAPAKPERPYELIEQDDGTTVKLYD